LTSFSVHHIKSGEKEGEGILLLSFFTKKKGGGE
jgi:hypothetical protein